MVRQHLAIVAIAASSFVGCSFRGAGPVPDSQSGASGFARPEVTQRGNGAQWVQFLPHTTGALYSAIVSGADGNVWFLDENAASLVRMSLRGSIKEFSLSGVLQSNAVSMAVGNDKKFYISDESTSIVRVTTGGAAQSFPIPSGDNTAIDGLAAGPDGNVWFAEFNHIAKITPAGKITEFPYPTQPGTNQYGGVTAGSDGNVWFAESSQNAIGRIVPSTGKIKMFPISVSCTPAPVVLAKDHNIWFFCLTTSPTLGRITPGGTITTFPLGGSFNSNETEQFCARGPDGEPWCASGNDNTVFRVKTSASPTISVFSPPLHSGSRPDALTAGPDGNVWVDTVGSAGEIDVLVSNPMKVTPSKLTFTMPGQMMTLSVSETHTAMWTATSSNPSVATVKQGGSKSKFTVTSVGVGTCKIAVSDSVGNTVEVNVNVT